MRGTRTGRRLSPGNIVAIVLAVVIMIGAIVGTIFFVRGRNKAPADITTTITTTTTASTTKAATYTYTVDLAYVERMLGERRFTDKFEEYTKDSFPTSNSESKIAYFRGIKDGNVVNPLLLAATSETLHTLGFNTPNVKPSELYDEVDGKGYLNRRGEETLAAVSEIIFSDETRVYTTDLGKKAGQYYNSSPSNENGVMYSQRVGISGNTACWAITMAQDADVDALYDGILSGNAAKADENGASASEKTVIQLCRCGNTATKTPPKTTPTTRPTTTQRSTTTTTKKLTPTTKPTTKPTTRPTTKPTEPSTTKPATTKNPEKDPVNQGNAPRGGGQNNPTERATSAYQPNKPTKATTVRVVIPTTKPTTRPTTKPTTPPASPVITHPPTTAPIAKPTEKPSSFYGDGTTTTVIDRNNVFTGDPVLPD